MGTMYAQENAGVAIGTPLPDASAILHVHSDTKGVLIPNVVLTDLNLNSPIAAEVKESLLVYNKTVKLENAGLPNEKILIAKGYYYWLATTPPAGRWVRVLTSEDGSEILAGQIQESFVEETKVEGNVKVGTGVFVYNPDKNEASKPDAAVKDRVKLDIPKLVNENQTLTKFELKEKTRYLYSDGKWRDKMLTKEEELAEQVIFRNEGRELALFYTDEVKVEYSYLVKDLLGASNPDIPAITSLKVDDGGTGLLYINDKGAPSVISLVDLVHTIETPTVLSMDNQDKLHYVSEKGTQSVDIRRVVKEPWHKADNDSEAIANTDNMFTQGWVGIGLNANEAKVAATYAIENKNGSNEKLRVNGSIYARNSYYADYVFENYFTKESSALKYDYSFKDLATVESFIKENYHLPGITPVGELHKSKEDGYLINVSELSIQLLEKVEELYLHTIDQQKIIEQQQMELSKQDTRLKQIESLLNIGK